MESNFNAGPLQHAGGLEHQVDGFEFSTGTVDEDDRAWHAGLGDFLSHLPGLADVMEHDTEVELPGQADHRHNVVVAVRVVMNDFPAFEHVNQSFKPEVPRRHLFGIAVGAGDLVAVFLSLDVLLANKCHRLGPGAGKWFLAHRVRAVGHLDPAHDPAGGVANEYPFDGLAAAELDVNGLSAEQMPRAGHDVERGQPTGDGPPETRIQYI